MKLYYHQGACSLAARIILHELACPCEYISVEFPSKRTERGEDFMKINPKGSVPVLVCDYGILTEGAVILQYLADADQADHLLPTMPDFRRYQVLSWLNFLASDIHKSFGPFFNPSISDDLKSTLFKPLLAKQLNVVAQALGSQLYLSGPDFTLPDAYLWVMLRWLPACGLQLADFPGLPAYFERIQSRPSAQIALQEEGLISA